MAAERGHAEADAAHLIQAIALEPRCVGRRALGALGVSTEQAVAAATAVERPARAGEGGVDWDDLQLRLLIHQAWENAGEASDAAINSGHLLIASSDADSAARTTFKALGLTRNELNDTVAQIRRDEADLRARVRRAPRNKAINRLPGSSVHWFATELGEAERLVRLLRDAGRDPGLPLTTGQLVFHIFGQAPRLWESFLRLYGAAGESLATLAEAAEEGCFWLSDEFIEGTEAIVLAAAPRVDGSVPLSRPCAEAVWRDLALHGVHGDTIFTAGVLAATCIATPGTAARRSLAAGAPAAFDPGPAAFVVNGNLWAGADAVFAIEIDLFPEKVEAGGDELAVPELDLAVVEADLRRAVREALAQEDQDDPRYPSSQHRLHDAHDSFLRPVFSGLDLTSQEAETLFGSAATLSLLDNDWRKFTREMAELGNSLTRRPQAAADAILRCAWQTAEACGAAELTREIRRQNAQMRATLFTLEAAREIVPDFEPLFDQEDAARAIRDWVTTPSFGEAMAILRRRRWLLSADLDDAVIAALDELPRDAVHGGFPPDWMSKSSALWLLRSTARERGFEAALVEVRTDADPRLALEKSLGQKLTDEVKERLAAVTSETLGEEEKMSVILSRLSLAAAVSDEDLRRQNTIALGRTRALYAIYSSDDEHRRGAEAALGEARRLLSYGHPATTSLADFHGRLHAAWFKKNNRPSEVSATLETMAALLPRSLGPSTPYMLGWLAALCLESPEFGADPARKLIDTAQWLVGAWKLEDPVDPLDAAIAGLEALDEKGESGGEALDRARRKLERLEMQAGPAGPDAALKDAIGLAMVGVGILSQEDADLKRALDHIDWIDNDARFGYRAHLLLLLCRSRGGDVALAREALAAATKMWGFLEGAPAEVIVHYGFVRLDAAAHAQDRETMARACRDLLGAIRGAHVRAADERDREDVVRHLMRMTPEVVERLDRLGLLDCAVEVIEAGQGLLLGVWQEEPSRVEDGRDGVEKADRGVGWWFNTSVDASSTAAQEDIDSSALETGIANALRLVTEDAPLVYLVSGYPSSTAYVVSAGGRMDRVSLDLTNKELADQGFRMVDEDEKGTAAEPLADVIVDIGHWLWPRLIEPLIERGYGFASRLQLVVTGAFALLPVQIAWREDLSAPDGRRYMGDEWELNFSPSATILAHCLEGRRPWRLDNVLAVAPKGWGPFPELPFVPREVEDVVRAFDDALVFQGDFPVEEFFDALALDHSAFHFSGHGMSRVDRLGQTLALAEGTTVTMESLRVKGAAARRLAVASACRSAVPDLRRINEGLSVSTAFLAAGYSGSIGMSWVVSDLSTTILMSRFYRLLSAHEGPIEGVGPFLRAAQQWVRTSSETEIVDEFPWTRFVFGLSSGSSSIHVPFEHPYHWAAPVLFGV